MTDERIGAIEARLAQLENEKQGLISELVKLRLASASERSVGLGKSAWENPPTTPDEKVKLFLSLFRCRENVYPRLWENRKRGTKGYALACRNEWAEGICKKPEIKCSDCPYQAFPPLDATAVRKHLEGRETIGTYAIREDGTCTFLAADFDGVSSAEDARAYRNCAAEFGIDAALERSRSGDGCHAWIFFQYPVQARRARHLGTMIMARASTGRVTIEMKSYDRFFPNQDTIPKGGFGNLIALPLQKTPRGRGNTVFLDDSLEPIPDQWEYLSRVRRLSISDLNAIVGTISPAGSGRQYGFASPETDEAAETEKAMDTGLAAAGLPGTGAPGSDEQKIFGAVPIAINADITVDISSLPSALTTRLKRTAIFANPKFFELQRLRFSTWKTPRFIFCGDIQGHELRLPRGCLNECLNLITGAGGDPRIEDRRPKQTRLKITFCGELKKDQKAAVTAIVKHDLGVLVAPPGAGKTVIACAVIARRHAPTLILVHRKPLVEQWRERIETFLGMEKKMIGVLRSGGKGLPYKGAKGTIDIGLIQSVSRMDSSELARYEHVIVDECHHVPAFTFETALKKLSCRYILGLTATPYRKDGHQPIIHMQCGPVRHEIRDEVASSEQRRRVIVRESSIIVADDTRRMPIHEFWEHLATDPDRVRMIADDIVAIIEESRFPLILSDRKEQLMLLSRELASRVTIPGAREFIMMGDVGKKARAKALTEIQDALEAKERPYILATGSLIGEGFDLPELDTLVLAMPISFKGKVIQYAGRIHRSTASKSEVRIYDYLEHSGLSISMYRKRCRAYRSIGYSIEDGGGETMPLLEIK